jgi:hypothetical protein
MGIVNRLPAKAMRKPAMRRSGSASRDDAADLRYAKLKPR